MPVEPSPVACPIPPSAYANPYAAGAVTMDLICEGVQNIVARIRAFREVRMLTKIGVLPSGWDAEGRHCTNR